MDIMIKRLLIGFAINLMFGVIAFMREMVDDTGFFAGIVMFTLVYAFMDWPGYAIVVIFFTITGAAINVENMDKAKKGAFELYKAKKTLHRVIGRSLAGVIFAGLFFLTNKPEYQLAFLASYAEAMFDTLSTKLGKFFSQRALMITTLKMVHRGTGGGISVAGTFFGLVGAMVITAGGLFAHLIKLEQAPIVIISATLGCLADSFLNGLGRNKKYLPNEFINVFSSLLAGVVCIFMFWAFTSYVGVKAFAPKPNPIFNKIDYKPATAVP